MGFSNPIIGGGGALVYPSIKSPLFQAGIQGWIVRKDGSAEFNNLSIRGVFNGNNYIINSSGVFIYNGTPGVGKLSESMVSANVTGSDQFGNTYLPGHTTYVSISGAVTGVIAQSSVDATTTFFYSTTANGTGSYRATGQIICEPTGSNTGPNIMLFSVYDNVGSSTLASFELQADTVLPGLQINTGAFLSNGGSTSNPTKINTDTWHVTGTLSNSWTGTLAYKLMPDNTVQIYGLLTVPAAPSNPSTIFTLPAVYRPNATNQPIGAVENDGSPFAGNAKVAEVTTSGILHVYDSIAAETLRLYGRYPIDL